MKYTIDNYTKKKWIKKIVIDVKINHVEYLCTNTPTYTEISK